MWRKRTVQINIRSAFLEIRSTLFIQVFFSIGFHPELFHSLSLKCIMCQNDQTFKNFLQQMPDFQSVVGHFGTLWIKELIHFLCCIV